MKLIVNGCEYDCVSATKTENEIKIVDMNGETATFSGIENISDCVLEGGEWDTPEPTEQEQLRADVDFLLAMGGVL